MSQTSRVGILSIGVHLPETIRKNDFWSEHLVERWRKQQARGFLRKAAKTEMMSEGMTRVAEAIAKTLEDPFRGSVERRVMKPDEWSSDMEIAAARDALSRTQVPVEDIGLLLSYSQTPDYLAVPTAIKIHRELGLNPKCIVLGGDALCNSFQAQMTLAEAMIASGRVKYALLVQSAGLSKVSPPEEQHTAWFGDGATAEIVGPARDGLGLLASTHRADGSYYRGLMIGCPGRRWYEGPNALYSDDPLAARKMLLMVADYGKEVLDDALAQAGVRPEQVNFFASHYATVWFRRVTQEYCGMSNAKAVDPFPWTASLGACNVPFCLALGEREGLIRKGDVVAMYSGGSGLTYTGAVLRWGV